MKAFVTGATGFVGAHITRALLERGATVRCLARESSRLDLLERLPIDVVRGDLTDAPSLRRGIEGTDAEGDYYVKVAKTVVDLFLTGFTAREGSE